ncbi:MAG: type II toxin-antitoxin system VapC family toxin [Bacteroidaceae bacterium]|nr:type II toxin-antitoxin system VapC family toxin [Bacteroidaceae bacterium]
MKKVVVNDTNVFIDLFSVGLLEEFFSLPWEVHTTEFVLLELSREGQSETVRKYKEDGRLHIPSFEPKEMIEIASLLPFQRKKSDVSFTDCSVWYYAKKNGYTLLTGDRKLRMVSEIDDVEVHGIIYVIDSIKEAELMPASEIVSRLELLMSKNPRLPKEAIEKRLKLWKAEIK